MWLILQRVVVPLVVLATGILSLVYAARYHTVPVSRQEMEEQEVEEEVVKTNKIAVPSEMIGGTSAWGIEPTEPGGQNDPLKLGAPPDSAEGTEDVPPPGMKFVTEKMTVIETVKKPVRVSKVVDEPEPWLVYAVSVGRVERREGAVWLTYGPGEEPPSVCPT